MKRLDPVVLLTIGVCAAGCNDYEGYGMPDGVHVTRLVVSDLITEKGIRGLAYDFDVSDSLIVFADIYADSAVVVMDTAGRVVRRLGPKGEGPGETESITDLEILRDTVWLWDSGLSRLYSLNLANVGDSLVGRTLPPPGNGSVATVHRVESRFFGTGSSRDGIFVEWSADSSVARWKGSISTVVARLPREQWLHVNYGFSAVEPHLQRLAIGLHQSGELLIVDLTTGETLADRQVGSWPLQTKRITRGEAWSYGVTGESIMGYYGVSTALGRIAALFIGKTEAEADLENSYDARDVHVFDWDGTLLEVYRLDRPVVDIALKEDRLYGLVAEPIPQIRMWRLPKVIPPERIRCF